MSSSGMPMDPLQMLSLGQGAQPAMPPDPLTALASGQHLSVPAAQQQGIGSKETPFSNAVAGAHQLANGAMFNLADPMSAAIGATLPYDKTVSNAPGWVQRYQENLASQRQATQAQQQSHPVTSAINAIGGGMLNPVAHGMPTPTSLGSALLQGAGTGGAYGAGSATTDQSSLPDAAKKIGMGVGLGGLTGVGTYGLGRLLAGGTRNPYAQMLHDEGVPLTMGESAGGTAQTLEDATTHIPMVGNAIKGRQADAVVGFNRAFYNRVLEPLGVQYAKDGPIGNQGVAKLGDLVGEAYDKAYEGASISSTPAFNDKLSAAVEEATNTLPKEAVTTLTKNVNRLLASKQDADGTIPPEAVKAAKNWFAEQSRVGPMASLDDRALGKAYSSVLDAIKGGIAETDPDKGALLKAADTAYSRLVPIQQAAALNNASKRAGVFTADQIGSALRSTDNSVRRTAFAEGTRPMQDLAQAGQRVLPSTVPDSGTAVRGLIELGLAGAAGHAYAPEAVIPAAAGLAGGTALYSKAGQKLANALIYGAPGARKAIGSLPPALTPGLAAALQTYSAGKP